MKLRELATQVAMSALVLILMSGWSSRALAQDVHSHNMTQELTAQQQSQASALIKLVRQHTARFQDVTVAEHEGYALQFGCVSGDDNGAMGLHYLNGDLVGSGVIDATRP